MINNYDSVVACPYTATPHSQKQESTSYTATKRNWLSFVTVLVTLFCFTQSNAQVTVTGASVGDGSYTTLSAAFTAINTATGSISISITGDTSEPAGGAILTNTVSTSITISPSGGAARTISGAATAGLPLIDLSGADRVTFDGLNTGGNSLTISNTTASVTSGTSTIRFIGGATNNIITNCTVLGSFSATSITTNGGTIFFSTDANTTSGNDNNTISNCNIGPAGSNLPVKAIFGNGSATSTEIGNSGIIITGNNIYDFFHAAAASAGIYTNSGCNTWTISNNKFYQTATRTWTTGSTHSAININGITAVEGAQGFTVTGNIIGFSSNSGTGTYTLSGSSGKFIGIRFNGITGGVITSVNNNTISNVSLSSVTSSGTGTYSPFIAILISNGLATTNSNIIGSQTTNGSLILSTNSTSSTDVYGIYNFSSDNWISNNNNIGGVSISNSAASGTFVFYGLRANTGNLVSHTASSNTIGGTVPNSISLNATGPSSQVIGFHTSNAQAIYNLNTIQNMTTNIGTGTLGTASMIGINVTSGSSSNSTISQNKILNLINTSVSAAVSVTGIQFSGAATINEISRNLIHSLNASSSNAFVNGITISGGITNNIYNNLIGNLTTPAANSTDAIRGINITSTTSSSNQNVYNNTIYLNANSSGANFGTSGIFHTADNTSTTSALDLQNNIIINTSTAAGTGKTVAYRRSGGGFFNFKSTSNNNLFFAGAPSAANLIMSDNTLQFYQTINDYKNASGLSPRETNSFTESSITPSTYFESTTGSDANYLQPKAGLVSQIEGGGNTIAITSPDYNGVIRGVAGAAFDVGAWEFNGVSPAPVLTALVATPAVTAPQCTKADRAIAIDVTSSSGTITSVILNYSHNGVVQTPVTMTNSTGNTYTGTMIAPTTGNATVTWSISATNSLGLTTVFNGTSYADEPTTGITATATASVNPVCDGSPTSLTASLFQSGSKVISSNLPATTASSYSNPIYSDWANNRSQILILGSELTASGIAPGNITSMSFPLTSTSTNTRTGYTIKIGSTSTSALTTTAFLSPTFTTVYSGNHVPVVGANTFTFTTPFVWDGSSNIIIETCWDNTASTATESSTATAQTTSFNSVISYNRTSTGTPICGGSNTPVTAYTNRPLITLGGTVVNIPSSVSWSDGSTTLGSGNPFVVSPTAATTYTGTATVAGCPVSASTSVTILALPTAPTVAANLGQCGAGLPTITMADPNSFTTPTFKWYDAATAGTLLQSSTSTTYTTAINATTTFYVSVINPTTGCESARTAVTANVSTADTIAISGAPTASVCLGQSFALTPTQTGTNNTFALTWALSTPGSGLEASAAGTLGTALTVTPTAAGTYTYTLNGLEASTGCTGAATTASITVVNPNAGINATATAATNPVCSGSPTSLSMSFSNAAPAVYAAPPAVSNPTADEDIGNITITQGATTILNNTSTRNSLTGTIGVASGTAGSYSNYTAFGPYAMTAGQTYSFSLSSLQNTTPYANSMAIYIDYNRDGDFADAGEEAYLPTATTGTGAHTVTGTFTIPSSALNGLTRMRVVNNEGTITGPSMTVGYGEYEEYMLNISSTNNGGGATVSTPSALAWSDGSATVGTTNPLVVNPTTTTTYTVNATVNGCPMTASTLVNVNALPTAPTVTASTQCGLALPSASVADPNNFTTPTFKWYDASTAGTLLQTSTSTTYTTAISTTTTFYVSVVNPTTGCESARTAVTVTVSQPDSIAATANDTSICFGESVTLTATNTASTPTQTYTYSWLSTSSNSGITTPQTGASISVTPLDLGSYTYTVTATGGACQTTATVIVTVNALPNITSATANTSIACAGSTINLAATANDVNSGTATLGAGAITPVAYSYDGIFEHYFGGNKTQFLVTAAELTALGVTAGDITSVGIDMATVTPQAYAGFAVSMASTANTNMSAGINSTDTFSPVFSSASYTPITGVNTFNFSTPYNWDGSSNLIIQFCWSNNNGGFGISNYALVDTQSYVSTAYYAADNRTPAQICGGTTASGTTSRRPKFIFGGQIDTNTTANYTWTWSDGATTVLSAATGSVILPASATTTYTATATNATTGCASNSLPITVTANPLPTAPTATNSVQCGTLVPTASVSDTNTFASPAIYNWYATNTSTTPLQSSTSATFTSLVNTTTTFYVAVANPTTGCESARVPVTVTVNIPDLLSATANDTTICIGQSVTISTANLASTPSQNYTYSWASTTGSGLTAGETAASFTVIPTTDGSFTYTVTGVDGSCQTTASVTVVVSPLPVVTLNVPSTILACAGSTVNLGASVYSISAGISTPSGTGTNYTSTSGYPTFFGNYWRPDWSQMVYTASELQAMGLTAGDITSISFNIGALPDPTTVNDYSISLGATSNNTLSAFQTTGLTTVYGPVNHTVSATGDITINFTTPYNWDGTSNIIVDVRGTGQWADANATTQYTTTTGNTVVYAYSSTANPTFWTSNPTPTTSTSRPNVRFGGQVSTNQNANYAWTWSDGTTNVLTAASGTVTLPSVTTTYTATATHLTTGCSNVANSAQVVATVVSTTAPAGVNTIAPSSICFGGSVSLSLDYTGSTQGLVYQWQSSTDNGSSWQDIATATASTFTTTQSVETQYRCKLISCGGTPGYSSVATVGFTNAITATTPATRCGTGTAIVNAVANTGANISWYANASGGNPVGTGSPFTTPVLSATTTYYVSAETITNANVGLGSTAAISTAFGTTSSTDGGMVFTTTTNNVVINSIDVLINGTGDLTIKLQNSTGTDIASTTVTGVTGTATALTNIVLPSTFVVPTAGTGYRILCTSRGAGISWYYQTGAYPFTTPGVSITSGWGWGATSTDLRFIHRMNLTVPTVCASPRVPVTVTVNPAPALSLSSSSATICSGSATAAITATAPDYDTFVWSPATGVTGNSATGWTFNPTATTVYTLTASQSAGICENIATFTVNVNAVPSAITFTPASPSVCIDDVLTLTAAGGVFSNTLLSQTMDFLPANFISSANATIANNTTYFAQGTGSVRFTVPVSANDWLALNQNVNLVGATSATLTFSHIAAMEGSGTSYDYGFVEYSTDGGSTWTAFTPANYSGTASTAVFNANARFSTRSYADWISTFTSATSTPGAGPATSLWKTETFNIPAAALTSSQFRIRFRYTSDSSTNYYGWLIDDVKIQRSQSNITWSPTTNLYTNAAATTPYTGGHATTVYVKSSSAATTAYTATSTNGVTGCSTTANVSVVVNPLPTVVTVNQTVCSPSTVDLTAAGVTTGSDSGLTYTYWTNAAATTALATPNAVASSGTYYIKGTNANGCSVVTPVTVTVNPLPVLTITNPATVCSPNTVDITAAAVTTGSDTGLTLTYWSDSSATTALTTASAVTTSGTYYIKAVNANGCEKIMPVTVTINVTSAPTGAATQTFCGSANITQLVATGSGVKWYDAATGGNLLPNITAIGLTNGTTYYATQTVNGCESTTRFAVTAVINAIPTAPNAAAQDFCSAPTVAQLLPNGSTINWYDVSTAGSPLASSTVLSATTYYVSQTINGCESARTAVTITITPIAAPTGAASQTIFGGVAADATIEDISVSGVNVIWYPTAADAAAGTNAIPAGTQLVDGQTYYAVSVSGSCRSAALAVTVVVVLDNQNFDLKALRYYPNPVIDVLTISYTNEITAVQVYDISGRLVRDMKPNSNEVTVDLSDLAASVYVVKVFADTTSGEFKVVKK